MTAPAVAAARKAAAADTCVHLLHCVLMLCCVQVSQSVSQTVNQSINVPATHIGMWLAY